MPTESPVRLTIPTSHVRWPGHGDPAALVWLPASYAASPQRRYPVVVLLHGGGVGADARSWLDLGLTDIASGLEAIFVAPDGGPLGWYTDWARPPRGATFDWARFHLEDVLSFIDREFRTLAVRPGRAVAGISMGGYGALSYAARRPDLFAAVTCLSGPADLTNPTLRAWVWLTASLMGRPGGVFGTFPSRAALRAHNPADHLETYRGMRVALFTGKTRLRRPRPTWRLRALLREVGDLWFADLNEREVCGQTVAFARALEERGIHAQLRVSPGSHDPARWTEELRDELPSLVGYLSSGADGATGRS